MAIYRSTHGIWLICGDTHRTKWVEEAGTLNIDSLIDLICQYIHPGDTVIDVGANIGDHTYFYRKKAEGGRVIAFEPDHEAFACLLLNCGWCEDFHQEGVGHQNSFGEMVRHPNSGQNYLILGAGETPVRTIDSLDLDQCNLIKIDVEGAELLVLKGAEKTIRKFRPILVVEIIVQQLARYNSDKNSLIELLRSFGYDDIRPLRSTESLSGDRVDVICFPSSGSTLK